MTDPSPNPRTKALSVHNIALSVRICQTNSFTPPTRPLNTLEAIIQLVLLYPAESKLLLLMQQYKQYDEQEGEQKSYT